MRLSWIGMMGAAVIAAPAIAAPNASGGPAPADARASLPASHAQAAAPRLRSARSNVHRRSSTTSISTAQAARS